jgi:hypothetical protein
MLSTNAEAPVVPESAMRADLSQSVEIFAHLEVQNVGDKLRVLAVLVVLLPVEEVVRYLKLARVLNDSDHAIDFFVRELSSALVEVDIRLFEHKIGETPPDTLNGGQREHDLVPPLNVGVEHAQNVLELVVLHHHGHDGRAGLETERKVPASGCCAVDMSVGTNGRQGWQMDYRS